MTDIQNLLYRLICILSSSHYVISQSKALFFVFAFKMFYVISQLVVHPLLRKILDPPLNTFLEMVYLMHDNGYSVKSLE